MTKKNDLNEFKDVKKGLPKSDASPNKFLILLYLLIGLSVGACMVVTKILMYMFSNTQSEFLSFDRQVSTIFWNFISWPIFTLLLVVIVGMFQVLLIRDKITSNTITSIVSILISGGIGGFVSSLFINVLGIICGFDLSLVKTFLLSNHFDINTVLIFTNILWWFIGLLMGFISGVIIGGLSGSIQYFLNKNSRIGARWLIYNLISWSVILGIGWSIILGLDPIRIFSFVSDAIGSIFVVVAHCFALLIFVHFVPQTELS